MEISRKSSNKEAHEITTQRMTYLCFTAFLVRYKPAPSATKRHIVARYPLVRIMATLSANPRDYRVGCKVHLKPLFVVTHARAPGSSVSSSAALVKPGISGSAVIVVRGRGSEHRVWYTTVF